LAQTEAYNDKPKLEKVVSHDVLPVISKLESLTAKSAGVRRVYATHIAVLWCILTSTKGGERFFFTLEVYEI
jgi:hypothetical protein